MDCDKNKEFLFERWRAAWVYTLGDSHRSNNMCVGVFGTLWALYADELRCYHGPLHLVECLARLDKFVPDTPEFGKNIAELAIFFHDAFMGDVVQPPSTECALKPIGGEAASALFAASVLSTMDAPRVARQVSNCVNATDHTRTARCFITPEALFVHDIDLYCLADRWERFCATTWRIRREYPQYNDSAFAAGRIAFFQKMAERPQIFWSTTFERFNDAAKANLQRALQEYEDAKDG